MKDSSTFQLIGARGLLESVYVFFIFGVVAIVFGNSLFDLSHDLPKRFEDTLKEPISMNLFSVLTFPSLFLLALLAYWKGEEIIETWQIDWLFLPFYRVGIAIGGAITGILLGLGVSLWMNTHH